MGFEGGDNITRMARPLDGSGKEVPKNFDFSRCLNIEELYALTDEMERIGQVTDAENIRTVIGEVRTARVSGMEPLAQSVLRTLTRTGGLRESVDRIVQGDSIVGYRDRLVNNGEVSSTDNLDIHV